MFAHQQAGIRPDFICLSKGLTGGTLPLSAVLTTDDGLRGLLRRRSGARLPALAFLHRQPAGLPRRAGHAGDLRAARRAGAQCAAGPRVGQRAGAAVGTPARTPCAPPRDDLGLGRRQTTLPDFARRYHHHAMAHGLLLRPIGRTHLRDAAVCAGRRGRRNGWRKVRWRRWTPRWPKSARGMIGCFVTGTDTGVGKTLVAARCCMRWPGIIAAWSA